MMVCNDRRWPESYRVMGLQSVELIVLGYNAAVHNPPASDQDHLGTFHNHLAMQAGACQNGTWPVGIAKAGTEEGVEQMGQNSIIAPSGEIVVRTTTLGDEVIVHGCDLDLCNGYKNTVFNFAGHRILEAYGLIVESKGGKPPPA